MSAKNSKTAGPLLFNLNRLLIRVFVFGTITKVWNIKQNLTVNSSGLDYFRNSENDFFERGSFLIEKIEGSTENLQETI